MLDLSCLDKLIVSNVLRELLTPFLKAKSTLRRFVSIAVNNADCNEGQNNYSQVEISCEIRPTYDVLDRFWQIKKERATFVVTEK